MLVIKNFIWFETRSINVSTANIKHCLIHAENFWADLEGIM